MGKSKNEKRDLLPAEFRSLEEAGEFWDNHDSSDYEADMEEVDFDVDLKSHTHEVRVTINCGARCGESLDNKV